MLVQILLLFIVLLILPVYLLATLWNGREESRFRWLVKVLYTGGYLLFLLLAGPWHWLSHYLRLAFAGLFVLAAYISYQRAKALPFSHDHGWAMWRHARGPLLELVVAIGLLALALAGRFYWERPVRLSWPLRDGWYAVAQGGNNLILNYHNTHPAQQYALDIVALNWAGSRANGIYPSALEQYAIYGETVYSPCDGSVLAVVDGLADQIPPDADREHPAGNHVIIACQGIEVALAHLQRGSVQVETGDSVTTGQPIGRVGNSGNTSEPHLHIHAVRAGSGDAMTGEGVPLLFDGRFPVRNTIFGR